MPEFMTFSGAGFCYDGRKDLLVPCRVPMCALRKNEAFAEEPSAVEPREEQIRNKTYQTICRYCGGQSEALGISAIEMRSGVERLTKIRKKE